MSMTLTLSIISCMPAVTSQCLYPNQAQRNCDNIEQPLLLCKCTAINQIPQHSVSGAVSETEQIEDPVTLEVYYSSRKTPLHCKYMHSCHG